MTRLRDVFKRLRTANLKFKPESCHLLRKQVVFLGHLISGEGVAVYPSKIKKIINPKTQEKREPSSPYPVLP